MPIFIAFSLARPGIEPEFTALVAGALSARPLIGIVRILYILSKLFTCSVFVVNRVLFRNYWVNFGIPFNQVLFGND